MNYKLKALVVCVALAILAICATIDLPVTLAMLGGAGVGIALFGSKESFISLIQNSFSHEEDGDEKKAEVQDGSEVKRTIN